MLLTVISLIVLQARVIPGLWYPNSMKDSFDKKFFPTKTGYMFRQSSADMDSSAENYKFSDGNVPNSPIITRYVNRNKRSINKSNKIIMDYANRRAKVVTSVNDIGNENPKFRIKAKPLSIFNSNAYDVALLIEKYNRADDKNYTTYLITENPHSTGQLLPKFIDNYNETVLAQTTNTTNNKRSMDRFQYTIKVRDPVGCNETDAIGQNVQSIKHRNVNTIVDNNLPNNTTAVEPLKCNENGEKSCKLKPMTQKGLIRVLKLLTDTFKKIVKQHSDIKEINNYLQKLHKDFVKNIEVVSDKFVDFESKYNYIVNSQNKIEEIEKKLLDYDQKYKSKEKDIANTITEFGKQQKNFLHHQKQHYTMQKAILAQNENIIAKQNAITKTQSEINYKQNNFAKILMLAKQKYAEAKLDLTTTTDLPKDVRPELFEPKEETTGVYEVITKNPSVETVKINLFSVPTADQIENQDHLLLQSKDKEPVDDLVYKYYFNNTFIDALIKNSLKGYINSESNDKVRNSKSISQKSSEKITLLLPVNKSDDDLNGRVIVRKRRWIHHGRNKKHHRRNKGKTIKTFNEINDEKTNKKVSQLEENHIEENQLWTQADKSNKLSKDAFRAMATSFCNWIGQNRTVQILDWCIEKTFRRLGNIGAKSPSTPIFRPFAPPAEVTTPKKPNRTPKEPQTTPTESRTTPKEPQTTPMEPQTTPEAPETTPKEPEMTPKEPQTTPMEPQTTPEAPETTPKEPDTTVSSDTTTTSVAPSPSSTKSVFSGTGQGKINTFFPDNDKLETNLQQYDSKPDTEGTVYYDKSFDFEDVFKGKGYSDSELLFNSKEEAIAIWNDNQDNQEDRRTKLLERTLINNLKFQSPHNGRFKKISKL